MPDVTNGDAVCGIVSRFKGNGQWARELSTKDLFRRSKLDRGVTPLAFFLRKRSKSSFKRVQYFKIYSKKYRLFCEVHKPVGL